MPGLEPHALWVDSDPAEDSLGQWLSHRQSPARVFCLRIVPRPLGRLSHRLWLRIPFALRLRRPAL